LESSLNFLSNNLKKRKKIWYSQKKKALSNFELTETQFGRTVRDKIAFKTHLE